MRLRLQIVLVAFICLLTAGMVNSSPEKIKTYVPLDPAAVEAQRAAVFRAEQAEDAPYKAARARAIERGALLEAQVREGVARRAAEKARAARKATPRAVAESAPAEVEIPVPNGSVEDAIATYFGDVYAKAYRVAFCESRHIPTAISPGGGNWGLFQVNVVHKGRVANMGYSWNQLLDPYVNAHVARSIYDEQGWGPWSCRGA